MKCDDVSLRSLLATELSVPVDPRLEAHVTTCVACQTRLMHLADEQRLSQDLAELASPGDDLGSLPSAISSSSIVIALDPSMADDVPAVCEPISLDFLAAPSHPEMLGRLGRYEIERLIGAGGMGIVLKGFDTELNRPVAIKVLAPHLAGSGVARWRFSREAQAAAAIVHEHVVPIHDVSVLRDRPLSPRERSAAGKDDESVAHPGLPYLVMPYIAGPSLQTRLDEQGHLSVKDIVRIAHQTALGLAAAHAQGIVHRDVKPANILLEGDVDRVRISDFGLARAADDASITRSGIIAGTPQYMSPEQTRGEAIDQRSDLFSLGSVLYAMCTGRAPFRAETTMGTLRKISDERPQSILDLNSDMPAWLVAIVDKLMAKSPADRFRSADELAGLLEQCLAHLHQPLRVPLPAAVQSLVPRQRPFAISRLWAGVSGLTVLVAVLMTWVGLSHWRERLPASNEQMPGSSLDTSVGTQAASTADSQPSVSERTIPEATTSDGATSESVTGPPLAIAPDSTVPREMSFPPVDRPVDKESLQRVTSQLDELEQEIQKLLAEISSPPTVAPTVN